MTHHEVPPRFAHRRAAAGSRRGSRAAPIIATALTVPVASVHFALLGLSAMAFDSCNSAADCPAAGAAVNRAALVAVVAVPVALTSWLWPNTRTYNRHRWAHLGAYVALAGTSAGLFLTVPVGR